MEPITPQAEALLSRVRLSLMELVRQTVPGGTLARNHRRGELSSRAKWLLSAIDRAGRAPVAEADLDADPTPEERAAIEARAAEARRKKFVLDARRTARKVARRS